VELVGPELTFGGGGGSYAAAACAALSAADGNVYAPPFNAPQALQVSCASGSVELIGPRIPIMGHQWRCAVTGPDGCIYAPPCNSGQVMRISCGAVELIGPEYPLFPDGQEKWRSCVLAGDGCIYCCPGDGPRVLRINCDPGTWLPEKPKEEEEGKFWEKDDVIKWAEEEVQGVSLIGPEFGDHNVKKKRWRGCAVDPEGEVIFCPPYFSGQLLRICCDENCRGLCIPGASSILSLF
ncbi:unnamed protein product, partial [Polarella glacialis]